MVLTRRLSLFLLAGGLFQWLVWPNFLRVVVNDDRAFDGGPTAFFWVHAVLTAASLALGTALLVLGWRAWRRAPRR